MHELGILQGRLTASNGRGIQFFPSEHWQEEFGLAKKIGFQCIEWLAEEERIADNPLFSDNGMLQIKELMRTHSITIPSVHGFYSKEESYRKILPALMERTAELGARTVLVSFFKEKGLRTLEDKERAVEQLAKALEVASSLQLKIGIETEMPAAELVEFIGMFKNDAVGVYYDIGNMVSMDVDVVAEIKLLGPRIVGAHVKDRPRSGGKSVPFGEGGSDFRAIFRAFREIGYARPFIFQGARSEGVDDVELNTRYYKYIRDILENIH